MTLGFLNPWLLLALAALPAIWWLLRAMPPQPQRVSFPATRILHGLEAKEQTPNHTPWWLTLIRMLAAGLAICAFAEPVLDQQKATVTARGPLVLVIDNDWAAAAHWDQRTEQAGRLIDEAERASLPVLIAATARDMRGTQLQPQSAREARDSLAALKPEPFSPVRLQTVAPVELALKGLTSPNIFWLSDGIAGDDGLEFAGKLKALAGDAGAVTVIQPTEDTQALALSSQLGAGGALEFHVLRTGGASRDVIIESQSAANQPLSAAKLTMPAGSGSDTQRIEIPLELRNQIARLTIQGERSAGAVQLLDTGSRWNRIGLVTGASRESTQPLLGHLFYVERALKPFAELVNADDNDSAAAIGKLTAANVSVLVLADVGKIAGPAKEALDKFLARGGVLVRFAGPRLEEASDDLLPVDLRIGGRSLGGALSWSTPQPLGAFEADSPFSGLKVPDDVRVSRQVLADPALLSDRTRIWARLADGTPLVTAQKRGTGWVILFHVTANSDWSNLPLSGLFVDMLRRITRFTGLAELERGNQTSGAPSETSSLQPLATLDGFGVLGPPPPTAEPLATDAPAKIRPDAAHPPGLYGREGATRALNVVGADTVLTPLTGLPAGVVQAAYQGVLAHPLKSWALAAALTLLLADMLAVFALQWGGWSSRPAAKAKSLALLIAAILSFAMPAHDSRAATADAFGLKASQATRLAYVLTGDARTDDTSRQGLAGLSLVLQQRTAVEPGEPIGVDVDKDDLTFFPVLYWPVTKAATELNDATRGRVDAYMKGGGLIVFDTQDEGDRVPNVDGVTGNTAFQRLASRLDIPRLEPVPATHVLTKSFYLLKSFPGRYDGGSMWVEAGGATSLTADAGANDEARQSDGVSSVIVTGNDLAGAWATDANGQGLYAVVPGGEDQREFANRVGVNIVMYALTGNYKADQVHVPSILERLGQ